MKLLLWATPFWWTSSWSSDNQINFHQLSPKKDDLDSHPWKIINNFFHRTFHSHFSGSAWTVTIYSFKPIIFKCNVRFFKFEHPSRREILWSTFLLKTRGCGPIIINIKIFRQQRYLFLTKIQPQGFLVGIRELTVLSADIENVWFQI